MKFFNKQTYLGLASFVIIFLLSFRKLLFIDGIPGHNWDWVFPYPQFLFQNLNLPTKFVWWRMDLGSNSGLNISHFFPDTILSVFSNYFNSHQIILIFFLVLFLCSFVFSKLMLDKIIGRSFLNYVPSLLYTFSPFLFNDIIGGSWYMWISYAAIPLYFIQLINFVQRGRLVNLAIFIISGIFAISSLQHFLIIELFSIIHLIFQEKTVFLGKVKGYFIAHVVLFIFNLYWLLPFVYSLASFKQSVLNSSFVIDFQSVNFSRQGLWNILSLVGYLDRNMYFHVFSGLLLVLFTVSVLFIWLKIILRINEKRENSGLIFWLTLLLVSAILIKGGNPPFSWLTMSIFEAFPLMRLYRSPQHMMFAAAFLIPIILATVLKFENLKKRKNTMGILTICVLIWISGWWISGDLGHEVLLSQKRDYIDFYTLSPDLENVYKINQNESSDSRYFFLPAAFSVSFQNNQFQNSAQGGVSEYMYLKSPVVTSSFNQSAELIEKSFFSKYGGINFVNYLSFFSVNKIVLRKDIKPTFTSSKMAWDYQKVKNILDANEKLTKISEGEFADVYQIKNEYYLPHFYIPKKEITSTNISSLLPEIVDTSTYDMRSVIFPNENKNQKYIFTVLDTPAKSEFENMENTIYEYRTIKHKPGTWDWKVILIKERLQELKLINNPEGLLNLEMRFANKRLIEIEMYGLSNSIGEQMKIYKTKVERAISSLNRINDSGKRFILFKEFRNNILYNLQTLREINTDLKDDGLYKWDSEIISLLGKLEKTPVIIPNIDPLKVNYKLDITNDGEYLINLNLNNLNKKEKEDVYRDWIISVDGNPIIKDYKESKINNWDEFGKINLQKKINAVLTMDYSKILPLNITEMVPYENKIGNWKPDTWYFITGKAHLTTGNVKLTLEELIDDGSGNKVKFNSRQTVVSLQESIFNFYVKSNSLALEAKIFLEPLINEGKFIDGSKLEDVKVYPLYTPQIILSTKDVKSKEVLPIITFMRVNPTKYKISFDHVTEPFTFVFNENFSSGWKLYPTDEKQEIKFDDRINYFNGEVIEGNHQMEFFDPMIFKGLNDKVIPENRHVKVNGYANGWYLNPSDFNHNGSGEFVVEFFPQRLFILGLLIDVFLFFVFMIILLTAKFLGKKNDEEV